MSIDGGPYIAQSNAMLQYIGTFAPKLCPAEQFLKVQEAIGIVDDFERALPHIEEGQELEELRKGVVLIYQKFYNTLEQKGLSKIETVQGDMFDAEIHEAITQIPAPSEDLKGKIIDCVEKGYKLGDKIIRYPKVVIGQ